MYILMICLRETHKWHKKFVQNLSCHKHVNVKLKLSCTVVADTTRLTCHYFVPIPPLLYCSDPKSALAAFIYPLHGCHGFHMLIMHHYMCIMQNNMTDLHNHLNNKISHARKSKVTSCGNVMSCKNGSSHGNSISWLAEIPWLVFWKFLFPWQNLAFYTWNTSCCRVCRNEVIIEQYHSSYILSFYSFSYSNL